MSKSTLVDKNHSALRIRIFWGETLLDAIELSPPRPFFIGDGAESSLPIDYTVPGLHAVRVPLVSLEAEGVRVHVPIGGTATRRGSSRKRETSAPSFAKEASAPSFAKEASAPSFARETSPFTFRTSAPAFSSLPVASEPAAERLDGDPLLDATASVDVVVGGLRFALSLGEPEVRCPRALGGGADQRTFGYFGLTAGFTAAFVAAMAYFTPPLGLTDDDDVDRDRMYLMSAYLDAAAEREQKLEQTPAEEKGSGTPNAATEQGARGEQGKMGKRESTAQNRRASGTEAGHETRIATTREEQVSLAQNFGMIGLLSSSAMTAAHAAWEDKGVGDVAAIGNMFGTEIGESAGSNGLSLFGLGEGGGDRGDKVGLFSIGTCRGEACAHGIGRFGPGGERTGPGHVAKAFNIRPAGNTEVSGTLPPEVIQRVVRQSFGRFRNCYEDGLRGNPTLEGRVTARFVIARDGSVAAVQSGGSDLPDSRVVSCVLRQYQALSFPAPKDGVVRVSYPLMFSPSA